LGANAWEVWRDVSFKYASGGMLSGLFLALSRALGETAPILLTGVVFYQPTVTLDPTKSFMALPYHIFILATQHSKFAEVLPIAAASGFILLIIVLLIRILAYIYSRRIQGNAQILHNVNLGIEEKAVTAIIGPSGCGKTTFLRTLNRLNDLSPDFRMEGEILLGGENIYQMDPIILRRRVGMVFQKPNPFPMSIFDNVAYGLRLQGIKDKRLLQEKVKTALIAAGLWEEVQNRLSSNAFDLSGGQQQRLCIARAIAVDPEVLLMDEPTSALDPAATSRVEELILELKKNYTIVLVTHNMYQAARVSDFTAFFLSGYLVEFNKTDIIFTNPKDERTQRYVTGKFG